MARDKAIHQEIRVTVNGRTHELRVPTHMLLQELLKEKLALTATKIGCGRGECGACTVLMDGKPINACLTLAVEADGTTIRTLEGEAVDGKPTRLQRSFVKHGAIQCGFCTPGMIISAQALLDANPTPTDEEIVEAIAGNLCRCTGYEAIIEAVRAVADENRS